MPLQFDENGLQVQTFDEVLTEVQDEFRTRISSSIATEVQSFAGQLQRIIATFDQQQQEKLLELYQSLDPRLAEGANLDIRNAGNLGVTRLPAQSAEVLGTITGTAATIIPNGNRFSVGGFEFSVIDGPYTIGGGGTVSNVRLQSTLMQAIDVSTLGAWSIVDAIVGLTGFDDDSQPILGRVVESDADYRARTEIERFRRSSGPLAAINANVLAVEGVTFAQAYHNVDPVNGDPVDSNGVPLFAINVVVEGGDDTNVAQAIQDAGPAGTVFFGTDVSVTLGEGEFAQIVSFDRVTDVDMWIRVTLTTSTSEGTPLAPAERDAAVDAALQAFTDTQWVIGKDAIPAEIAGAITSAGVPAIDDILVELSLDNGGTDPFSAVKRVISIRERASYATARLSVVEV